MQSAPTYDWQPGSAIAADGAPLAMSAGWFMVLRPTDTRVEQHWWRSNLLPLDATFEAHLDFEIAAEDPAAMYSIWQLNDGAPPVEPRNPFAAIVVRNGLAALEVRHHVGAPVLKATTKYVRVCGGLAVTGGRMVIDLAGKVSLADGRIEIWRNGVSVGRYDGPLGYNFPQAGYAKAGLYSWEPRTQDIRARMFASFRSQAPAQATRKTNSPAASLAAISAHEGSLPLGANTGQEIAQ